MAPESTLLTAAENQELAHTILVKHRLEEQYASLEQQHHTAAAGMWVFLATEVMFFGTLFAGLAVYRYLYGEAFEKASVELNWIIGGINTVVLLVSSLFMVLAVHAAQHGRQRAIVVFLALTATLGTLFLALKGLEYYTDFRDHLVLGSGFDEQEWIGRGLTPEQIPHVKLFLLFYWIMTAFHGLHVTIGVCAVLTIMVLAIKGHFSPAYYSPVDVVALYWHFVDVVWIFLLPMLYLLGTHKLGQ